MTCGTTCGRHLHDWNSILTFDCQVDGGGFELLAFNVVRKLVRRSRPENDIQILALLALAYGRDRKRNGQRTGRNNVQQLVYWFKPNVWRAVGKKCGLFSCSRPVHILPESCRAMVVTFKGPCEIVMVAISDNDEIEPTRTQRLRIEDEHGLNEEDFWRQC